jgi:integrase
MTVAAPSALTFLEAHRMINDLVKDKRYRETPLGPMVSRYLRWFKNEWGATPASVRDYEAILARMCLALGETEFLATSTEDLREVIDACWGERSARTRAKVTSVIRSFWSWAEEQGHIAVDPAHRIRRPRAERKVARILPADARPRLLTVAKHPRDRLALFCLLALGVRRAELAGVQVRDFDAQRGVLRVYGKGQKERLLPLPGPVLVELRLFLLADLPHLDRPPTGDDYLLYPIRTLAAGKGSEGQLLRSYVAYPKDAPSPQSVHRWWYKKAQAAGLVGPGVTSGLNMHQARHLFAVELRRVAGIDAASQALGHSDLSTTLGIYGHRDAGDLEGAMEAYGEYLDREASSVPPDEES